MITVLPAHGAYWSLYGNPHFFRMISFLLLPRGITRPIHTERQQSMDTFNEKNRYEDFHFHDNSYINVAHMNSPASCGSHWHTYGEFVLSTSDAEAVFTLSGQTFTLHRNELLMIWPCEPHSVESAKEGSLLIIQFPGQMLSCTNELHTLQDFITKHRLLTERNSPELISKVHSDAGRTSDRRV